ncbi:hypothetical protein BJV78DRAFT_590078 [Lactifluus subvellereus]|nr:hypothetical protein BJV78DRAFT_590078 [Lactifluus subvellereus]
MIGGQSIVYPGPAFPHPTIPTPYHPGIFTSRPSFLPHQHCSANMIPLPQAVGYYSQGSPVINDHPAYDLWRYEYGDVFSIFPGQVETQAVPGSGASSMGYMQPPYIPPVLQDMALEPASERSVRSWPCPICAASFRRWQDQKRHILSHLPHWIYCPDPDCSWRGDRPDAFKKHWCGDHPSSSQEPDKHEFTIYDPEPLIESILEGSILIEEAQSYAVSEVRRRTQELDKSALWDNSWGRKGRKAGRFERSRK